MPVPWKALEDSLRRRNPNNWSLSHKVGKLHDDVASVPAGNRVPLLLEAYEVYRGECDGPRRWGRDALVRDERAFEKSAASLLISALLKSRMKPTEQVEAGMRLDALARDRFLQRLAGWIVVPQQMVELTDAWANVLRLLVYHATLFPAERVVPMVKQLIRISWKDPMSAWKVYNALATLLSRHPNTYRGEALELCERFAASCYEVGQLQSIVDRAGFQRRKEQTGRDRAAYRRATRELTRRT